MVTWEVSANTDCMGYSVKLMVNVIVRVRWWGGPNILYFTVNISQFTNSHESLGEWCMCTNVWNFKGFAGACIHFFFFYKFSSQVSCCWPTLVAKQPIHDDKKCPRTLESCAKVNSFCTQFTLFYLKWNVGAFCIYQILADFI